MYTSLTPDITVVNATVSVNPTTAVSTFPSLMQVASRVAPKLPRKNPSPEQISVQRTRDQNESMLLMPIFFDVVAL